MARDSHLDRLDQAFRGKASIGDGAASARAFGEARSLAEDDIARLCVVVEEWFANLHDHGGLSEQDEIRLEIATDPAGIRVAITDPGQQFDPRNQPPAVDIPERGGGAGIGLIRAWAKVVGYQATGEGNRLELLLPVNWEA